MKTSLRHRLLHLFALLAALLWATACGDDHGHDHDHDGHDHGEHGHSHGPGSDHSHEKTEPGPNGGRLVTEVTPHLEFLLLDDRKVRISAVTDGKVVPIAQQVVNVIGGNRESPTRLRFVPDGDSLLSDAPLPAGDNLPVILQIQATPEAETVAEKFNLNLADCPTCDYKEYACICGH